MHITRPTLLKIGGYIALSLLIGGVIIFMDAWDTAKIERQREAQTEVTYRDTVDGVDWYTYTNRIYGYEISYPEGVDLQRTSETTTLLEQTKAAQQDVLVFLTEKENDSIFTISAGTMPNFSSTNHKELRYFFDENLLPIIAERSPTPITDENLIISDTTFQNRPSITVQSPLGYRLVTSNTEGMIMTVSGNRYTGATTTPKEQLTREIMETFRVLD